jgi:hypothetical protein
MKRTLILLLILGVMVSMSLSSQAVSDNFSTIRPWVSGYGEWQVQAGRLAQNDAEAGLARIDREIPRHDGIVTIEFEIMYKAGGYKNETELRAGHYHAGFGVHLGVRNPALGQKAWGNGQSYLLWFNLDTRPETMKNAPLHYGFRAQVYESTSSSTMDLARIPQMRQYAGTELMSFDIIAALQSMRIFISIDDLLKYLDQTVPIKIEYNTRTGDARVKDPTSDYWFWVYLDPVKLRGNYFSFRTNSLAAEFDNFRVFLK